ncbi:MAG: hypothetical protein AAF757_29320 [Cyanobacteria bacterium P01_D01_bin.116]
MRNGILEFIVDIEKYSSRYITLRLLPITNYQLPITNYQSLPIPN